jgi:hypothetical protein
MVSKMECLWKPAQSGKTRTIQEMIRADDGMRKHLNVVICSKNRLLVSQLEKRMTGDLYAVLDDTLSTESEETVADDAVVGGVYSWMSGTKRTNISVRDLAWRIFRNEVSMVVCCSHKARFRYLRALLDELEAASFPKPVNVWIDEADASVKLWTKPEFDFARYKCVRKVTLVSATFDEVFKFYDRIRVKAFPETHPECYRGLKDCEIKVEKNGLSPADYLASILEKHPELTEPRTRLFAPGAITVDSHNRVADVLVHYGFAFLILNGKEKAFCLPDGTRHEVVLSADGDELSRIVAEKYVELGLERYPFAVTGHLCLSRGITFQSRDFLFDYGVLPDIPDAASAYQCVARVLGNVGSFSDIKPVIYMSDKMEEATTRQERIAVNLARLVHENEWADVGEEEVALAAGDVPKPRGPPVLFAPRPDGSGEVCVFSSHIDAKAWTGSNLRKKGAVFHPCDAAGEKTARTHFRYRGESRLIESVEDTLASGDLGWGQSDNAEADTGSPRIMPVLDGDGIGWIVVFKPHYRR